ncbi:phosphoglycerate kinase [Chloroflexota bacterium]
MNKMTVRDIAVKGNRVLLRVDFNVPLDAETGEITDDRRIRAALPTISYLIEQGARVVICSHLGRPGGQVAENLRLSNVGQRLASILGKPVATTGECVGPQAEAAAAELNDGEILLLENIRFHPGEEENDPSLAWGLARLADIYVNDAFGTAHRKHASIVGVADCLPAVAGFLLEKEIKTLGGILEDPVHPFATLLGGAKVSDKVSLLENIMDKVDYLLVGGGMAATLLKAKSYEVGRSLIEADRLDTAAGMMDRAAKNGVRLFLPVDVVVAGEAGSPDDIKTVLVEAIPPQSRIMDIGPRTVASFTHELEKCQTIFWNGPMGMFEIPQFAAGTETIARLLAGIKATTIIGGGSTAEAVDEMKLADKMTFVSTGGGASLRFLSGKVLPGVAVLKDKEV